MNEITLSRPASLELVCVRCTRFRKFYAPTPEAAGRIAEQKGWARIGGKVYCHKCPHPIVDRPATPSPEPVIKTPIRMESTDEIIARLIRDGLILKRADGLVSLSPEARADKIQTARALRPQGVYA